MASKNVNSITITGRLAADAEVKQWDDGCTIEFRIGCSDSIKRGEKWEEETDWFNVRVNRKSDKVAQYLTKGGKITVTGRMKCRQYEKDGQKRQFWYIKAQDFELPPKGGSGSSNSGTGFGDDAPPF